VRRNKSFLHDYVRTGQYPCAYLRPSQGREKLQVKQVYFWVTTGRGDNHFLASNFRWAPLGPISNLESNVTL